MKVQRSVAHITYSQCKGYVSDSSRSLLRPYQRSPVPQVTPNPTVLRRAFNAPASDCSHCSYAPAAAQVAAQMARPAAEFQAHETVTEIEQSCRRDLAHFPDPTVQLQLELQLAIAAERYSEAARCAFLIAGGLCDSLEVSNVRCRSKHAVRAMSAPALAQRPVASAIAAVSSLSPSPSPLTDRRCS